MPEGKFLQAKYLYLYASIYKRYLETNTDAMGNCEELEVDLSAAMQTEIVKGVKVQDLEEEEKSEQGEEQKLEPIPEEEEKE